MALLFLLSWMFYSPLGNVAGIIVWMPNQYFHLLSIYLKRHVGLCQGSDFKTISQKWYLGDPLPKLLSWFCSAEQMATRVSVGLATRVVSSNPGWEIFSFFFSAHLSHTFMVKVAISQCLSCVMVILHVSSVVCRQQFTLNKIFFETSMPRALIFGVWNIV